MLSVAEEIGTQSAVQADGAYIALPNGRAMWLAME
jgi:hypothetical protein